MTRSRRRRQRSTESRRRGHYLRGTASGTYYVHVHVNSQHRNTDNALDGPIAVYELAVNKQNVEIDRFDNEASRVIALACLGYNVWYLSRGRNRVPAAS